MRLFIAADLPQAMLEALAETSALLRECVRGRYVAPDSYHVTLAFLGDVERRRIDDAAQALDQGCWGYDSFEVSFGLLGSFGKRSHATLWQGFDNRGMLAEVAGDVRAALRVRVLPFDNKSFLPHVTLMRDADLTDGQLPAPVTAKGQISTITLYSSDLSGSRPVYEPIHTTELHG